MIPRRTFLAAGPLTLAACGKAEEAYFGTTDPPKTQRLVYLLDYEPGSIDPALAVARIDALILSLFEGLTGLHPVTSEPISALATHYDVTSDGLRYTFCLRGHPQPQGKRLSSTADLPPEYSRGYGSPLEGAPALWSDGVPITAHDFVYSWRRALDPSTAAQEVFRMYPVQNAEEITSSNLAPEKLAVRVLDDFSLQVDLRMPAPFFLELVSSQLFCPVPRHVVELAGSGWTEPGRIVTSGAFTLRERRPYDRILLSKNRNYYEARQVALDELTFLIVSGNTPLLNLYKTGVAAVVHPFAPAVMPTLRRKKDFQPQPYYASEFNVINTRTPPLDDVRVRYALNMATDTRTIADLFGAGSIPATGPIPPTHNYVSPGSLAVEIDRTSYDVLSFNPHAAREVLSKTRRPLPDRIEYLCPNQPDAKLWAQVLKWQWKVHLGVELVVRTEELQLWIHSVQSRSFRHVAFFGSSGGYRDPAWFLDLFSNGDGYGSGWSDAKYNTMLLHARSTSNPALRLARLAECECHLLRAMPILPLCYDVLPTLRKPYVKGLGNNLLDRYQLKYAWIDTKWRPQ